MDYNIPLEELVKRFKDLLTDFVNEHADLLAQNPHEDSIGDELKPYLKKHFGDFPYNINHNYDLMHEENILVKKAVEILLAELPKSKIPKNANPNSETIKKEILPDYIFHDLQSRHHNFIMIEIKKSTSTVNNDRVMDDLKLKAATNSGLNYRYGVFIDITTGDHIEQKPPFAFKVYEHGEITFEF